jgi:Xaa-Pro aminopeptidase
MTEPVDALRALLRERGLAALIVPREDECLGEYIPAHRERLRWLTGFTGSAGRAVVLAETGAEPGAALFVDGRYTVQARQQVSGEHFSLHHLIEEPPAQWLCRVLEPGDRVASDPRLHAWRDFRAMQSALEAAGITLVADEEGLVDRCWTEDRPAEEALPARLLDLRYTGESSADKRGRLGASLSESGVDAALIFAPDSVSWLLNLRGCDVPRLPVLQGWALLHASGAVDLVVDARRLPEGVSSHVGEGLRVHTPEAAASVCAAVSGRRVLVDQDTCSAALVRQLESAGAECVWGGDPVRLPKACKNAVELTGMREAHVRDGCALVRFLAWLDAEVEAGQWHDEAMLADRLHALRAELPLFQEPSFDTISAAGANAALCHYNYRNGEPARLSSGGVYLVDSGGQYLDGTTDVTRTVAIGPVSSTLRRLFTLVLKGHIALDQAVFPAGTTGTHLDALARQFLWREGLDYDHGTGHGVGAFLSVHEGPQRIARAWNSTALAPGMVVSNEPGYYREGAFGIRCENLVAVVEKHTAESERSMLGFEALTLAPFDRRLIDTGCLTAAECAWVDAYHRRVYEALETHLGEAECAWLCAATAPLSPGSALST